MQTIVRVTLILGFTLTAIFAQDCMNPLLNRTDIQTRFGGSANILNTSRIAGNLSVCPFLSGQSVCVSDEGFASLKTFLEQYKSSFTERSQISDEHKFAGIGEAMKRTNMNGAKIKSMFNLGMLFNQTILSFNASGLTQPYNFTDFYTLVQQMRLAHNKTTGSERDDRKEHDQMPHEEKKSKEPKEDHSRGRGLEAVETTNKSHNESGHKWILIDEWNKINFTKGENMTHRNPMNETSNMNESRRHNETQMGNLRNLRASNERRDMDTDNLHKDWIDLQKNLMQAKAKCATSVMKHMYFASCMAAASNVTTLNQSNSSNATMKFSPNACSGFKSKCDDYFMYSTAAESTRAIVMNANSSFAAELYAIVTSDNDSATINDELNTLATTVLAQMNASDLSFVSHKNPSNPSNLPCNGTNSSASDCNYVCLRVLNTTGIDEDAFNNVSAANSTSRRSLSSTESITIDQTGANPDVVIDDGDSAVVVSVSSIPDSSSGSQVIASIMMAIGLALLILSA